jgi:Pyruvate/2-oxoacid:ferredoxin oxidoreductase gamma subunit
LGKFAQASKLISLESLKIAIQEKFSGKGKEMVEKNILAVERAYQA